MTFQTQLRIPGPTPLPERVVRSMNRPMIDHRGPEFAAILAEITAGAKRVFKTSNDLLLLTSSGTGGLESAVANLVSPGDEVIVALCGNFGERFAAVTVAFALQEGLRMLEEEGLENVYERHAKLARATQSGLHAMGFQLFAQEGYRSNTVTSAVPPPGVDVAALRKLLDAKYGVVIAGGQGKMTGKMIRVGHLGAVAEGDVVQVLWSIEQALEGMDVAPAEGRAVAAATASLQGVPA